MEFPPFSGLGAEGIVIVKNSCLYGGSILVEETKGVKGLGLDPLGKTEGETGSGCCEIMFFDHVLLQSLTHPGGDAGQGCGFSGTGFFFFL